MKSSEFLQQLSQKWKGTNNPRFGAITSPMKGKKHTLKSRTNMSKNMKGRIPWNKGKKGVMPVAWNKGKTGLKSNSGSFKKGQTPWNKGKTNLYWKSEKNPNWKGGVTPVNSQIRHSLEYKLWRTAVFQRDNYTCVWCGICNGNGKTIRLEADHIKPFALFPELRFSIDNGRTLCKKCHMSTDTYAKRLINYK